MRYIVVLLTFFAVASFAVTEVRVQQPEDKTDKRPIYFRNVLKLALDKTAKTDGPAKWVFSKVKALQGRNIKMLKQNKLIDLLWTMTSKKREEELLPIRVPLLKGLLGHRICIVRKGDENKFKGVKSVKDVKKKGLVLGSGIDWPDTEILKANKLDVFTGADYVGLFSMLQKKRFDCYARGVPEPWSEVVSHKEKNLVVDKNVMFIYQSPIYFFVNKKNTKLADRIERGLRLAIKDGSFDKAFYDHHKELIKKTNFKKRNKIYLKNPIMPPLTPVKEKSFWLKVD